MRNKKIINWNWKRFQLTEDQGWWSLLMWLIDVILVQTPKVTHWCIDIRIGETHIGNRADMLWNPLRPIDAKPHVSFRFQYFLRQFLHELSLFRIGCHGRMFGIPIWNARESVSKLCHKWSQFSGEFLSIIYLRTQLGSLHKKSNFNFDPFLMMVSVNSSLLLSLASRTVYISLGTFPPQFNWNTNINLEFQSGGAATSQCHLLCVYILDRHPHQSWYRQSISEFVTHQRDRAFLVATSSIHAWRSWFCWECIRPENVSRYWTQSQTLLALRPNTNKQKMKSMR